MNYLKLTFPKTGALIYIYMQSDWNKVHNLTDALNFCHKWLNDMLTSKNQIRIEAIKSIVYPLFSMITNRSYESKVLDLESKA